MVKRRNCCCLPAAAGPPFSSFEPRLPLTSYHRVFSRCVDTLSITSVFAHNSPSGTVHSTLTARGSFFSNFFAALWFGLSLICPDGMTVRAIFICFTEAIPANRQPWYASRCGQNLRWVVIVGDEARGRVFPVPLAFCFPSSSISHLLRCDKHFLSPRELPHRHYSDTLH